MPPLLSDEDKNFGGSLVLDFRKWWRHVKTIYQGLFKVAQNSFKYFPRRRFWWVIITTIYQLML